MIARWRSQESDEKQLVVALTVTVTVTVTETVTVTVIVLPLRHRHGRRGLARSKLTQQLAGLVETTRATAPAT